MTREPRGRTDLDAEIVFAKICAARAELLQIEERDKVDLKSTIETLQQAILKLLLRTWPLAAGLPSSSPKDVLADLFGEELHPDPDHFAKVVIERLRDAGFVISKV